ncbi:AEC family transporter [Pseudodesulfovibrio sp.]|uniref:AEC family transporter n=1 Tax=Pseudodesulfovibrio sp. TaxID=2035812 RepID=UPI0026144C6A|nr:AEC family transporter [Pseudodesulfovibrio sp.]MDD3311086.1 AEC family transporter [Pseudodesulfovibrio sp.]
MSVVFLAVAPIFALILLGFVLNRLDFPSVGFWPMSERLTYYVLFPALLISGLSGRTYDASAFGLAAVLFGSICLVSGAMILLRRLMPVDGPGFTSIFQGGIRPNTYVGLSLAAALLGPEWMTLSGVALLTIIPLVNVLCVLALARHGSDGGGLGRTLAQLAKNPLILSCVAGFALNGFGVALPAVVEQWLVILGKAALPMGLLAVGAGLQVQELKGQAAPLVISSLAHLVALPLAAFALSLLFGLDPDMRNAALIYTAIPVAVSAFILARQMGGDHRLMASIITVQTLLSAATMPLVIGFLAH